MNLIQRLFGRNRQKRLRPQPQERPSAWNLTISDLMDEMKAGKRTSIGQPETDWARAYELSLIPKGSRFPRQGDVYESLLDQTVGYLTAWSAPFTGSGVALLPKGERVWIDGDPRDETPLGTYALPVEYDKLQERMVPREEREDSRYGGFYFYFTTVDLNEKFALVETAAAKQGERAVPGGANNRAPDPQRSPPGI